METVEPISTGLDYREILNRELQARRRRRPSYSLRAFARDLGIPAPKLSEILRGISGLSGERATRIAKKIGLKSSEAALFVSMVESEHSRSKRGKLEALSKLRKLKSEGFGVLDLERFRIISDWYHFALLELTESQGFKPDPKWISRKLGITVEKTRSALDRLLDFGLLKEDPARGYVQTEENLATPSGIPSRELREHHSQILEKALQALHDVPVDERDFSAMTMAIDSDQLPAAKEALREFRRKFCKDIQAHSPKDNVYCLSIQFFPLLVKDAR